MAATSDASSSSGADDVSRTATTPATSPPSEAHADQDYDPVSENMREEEKRTQAEARKEQNDEKKRSKEWASAGKSEQTGQFKKLMHLVEQSKVFATIMQQRMQQEETKREKQSTAEKKRLEKREEAAEEAAVSSQRRATRAAASKDEEEKEEKPVKEEPSSTPKKKASGRGRPKKQQDGTLSQWLDKDDVNAKSGGMTVAEAVAEAADEDGVASSSLGAQNLRSAAQPAAVTGGVMRSYQLEGLFWLRSLYENGLNGILADEMGLGKTVQTISFLAFLREMKSFGPFLVVAPLSTLSNWIDEFERWTPSIQTVLYHGSQQERAEIRQKRLKRPGTEAFPVVCTSYEICMNDRKFLSQYGWKFIIIDEGHRLKNLNCRLIKELKQYQSANRLLITGTPLQNNLAELWSLLNFLMPDVFDTLENFESFFDFSAVLEKGGHREIIAAEQKNNLVASLHAILKPFLLRRVKTDVETELPQKREYILYAPLTAPQRELYRSILDGSSRRYLEQQVVDCMMAKAASAPGSRSASRKRKSGDHAANPRGNKSAKTSRASTPGSSRSTRKAAQRHSYKEVSDRQYFKELEQTSDSESGGEPDEEEQEEMERAKTMELAKKEIANKKLQNPIMQLRLACNSPHNFYWPWQDGETPDQSLVASSGKLMLLDQLLPYLFKHGHKVLIFSQFKSQLDILEDWAALRHDWAVCRIDGAVPASERREQIAVFNDPKSSHHLFLLSTRAGGQGINLAAADTVILFDSDWNPQQDLQAQDRAHRIGQTRPVIVYRLATKGTVEQTLLEKAEGKRRLEKLVIRKGKFRNLRGEGGSGPSAEDMDELARALEQQEGEDIDMADVEKTGKLLSEAELKIITDRSDEAFTRAEKGEHAGSIFKAVEATKDSGVLAGVTRKG